MKISHYIDEGRIGKLTLRFRRGYSKTFIGIRYGIFFSILEYKIVCKITPHEAKVKEFVIFLDFTKHTIKNLALSFTFTRRKLMKILMLCSVLEKILYENRYLVSIN